MYAEDNGDVLEMVQDTGAVATGPASYIVDASDLRAVTDRNALLLLTLIHVLPSYIISTSGHLLIT